MIQKLVLFSSALSRPAGYELAIVPVAITVVATGASVWMAEVTMPIGWLGSTFFGHFPDGELDHKNHNRSSCRIADLREATPRQNKANSKARKHNRSGLKGVSKRYHRWRAAIRFNGKSVFLGSFATPEAAHAAYCYVAKRLHGEFFCNGKD
jgi:HNH endonuclease